MSLTVEILKKSDKLEGLSDDQLNAIVLMSKNDEDTVIKQKTGEIYGNIDRDIEEAIGTPKPNGVKTYDWLKDILPDVKKANEYKTTIATLKTEKSELEKKVTEGKGLDEELQKQVEQKTKKIEELQKQMQADKELLTQKTQEFEKTNFDLKFSFLSSQAEKDLEFIDAIQPSVAKVLINSAKSKILSEYEVAEEEIGGEKVTVFKKDGVIAKNTDNELNPFTLTDLFKMELKDSLKAGTPKKGAETKPKGGSQTPTPVDLSGATTQVEADEIIATQIMQEGISRDSEEFQPRFNELRTENNIKDLPMK